MAEQKRKTIKKVACACIKNGLTNEETLAAVTLEFPDANTSRYSIAWYRSYLRRNDPFVPKEIDALKRRAYA